MDSDPAPELHLRAQIAEQTTTWIHRYGGPRVLTAMREWLDYMDRQVKTMQQFDGSPCPRCGGRGQVSYPGDHIVDCEVCTDQYDGSDG